MTVVENLRMHGYAAKDKKWMHEATEAALAIFPRLDARRNQPASTLSGGERQMLALAKTIVGEPRVLVVDEFSLGLAPVVVGGLMELVRRLNERGSAVLLVEQSVNVALSLVHRAYMMEKGEIIAEERRRSWPPTQSGSGPSCSADTRRWPDDGGFDFGIDRLIIGLFTGLTYGLLADRPGAGLQLQPLRQLRPRRRRRLRCLRACDAWSSTGGCRTGSRSCWRSGRRRAFRD